LEGVADVVEAELTCFFFQGRNQALVEADGGVTFAADDVVVMVLRLFREVESFSPKRDSLQEAGFIKGFENPIDSGSIAGGGTDLGINLVWRERSDGFFDEAKDGSATRGGFQARLAKGVAAFCGWSV
jgi:hypothetical protein